MATSSEQNPDLVDQFVAVTGAARHVAVSMLEACAGQLDLAVGMHMDSGGGEGPSSSSGADDGATASAEQPPIRDDEDEVRAPIPQKTEVLVEEDGSKFVPWRMRRPRRATRSVFDGFRDFQAETRNFEDGIRGKASSKKRNLEDLFRPPVDITHKGTFQTARDIGSLQNRWLLINVQNVQEFACQTLNRDVWSCPKVRHLIKENFIFWQVYNDSDEGLRFMQFYKVNEWPHVAIVDPFTGENQIVWHKISDGTVFCDLAKEFLSAQSVPDKSQSPSPVKRARREPSIVDASEQDQMEAAIQASLMVNKHATPSSPQYVMDSDSEADIIEDSDVDGETFSDSDDIVISGSPSKKSSTQNGETQKTSSSLSSQSSPSSYSRTVTSPDKMTKSPRKDLLSRCKNLSTTTMSCNYSPNSLASEEAGSSSSNGSGSNIWLPYGNSSSHATNPLRVDVDSLDPPCSALASPSVETYRPSTSRGNDGCEKERVSDWKEFWGDESDPVSKIMLRLPDNRREQIELPCSSSLKALKVWCSSHGFPSDKYELVTNFPRRKLSEMCEKSTLKDIGLYPQETVFVQDL